MSEPSAAVKLCECGCGQPTPLAKQTRRSLGHVKGQGIRFLPGHSHRGKVVSAQTRERLSASTSRENNGHWRGDEASYRALHSYLSRHFPKTGTCEQCGRSGRGRKTEYSLIHGRAYTRNRDDYRELCPRCHKQYDFGGRPIGPDRAAKMVAGRKHRWAVRGEDVAGSKLTAAAVVVIRNLYTQGATVSALARDYGVTRASIRDVVRRKSWAHIE